MFGSRQNGGLYPVRLGEVSSVYPERGTVRVRFADKDDTVSPELPLIGWMPGDPMPANGAQVLCLYLETGDGFCLGRTDGGAG
ncbi:MULTISPECIES: hypothetical protein [Paenibacillus]|uniref:hypothetical protein n=1 Tax=Paenibacillus TaxID=44249 RepID=UPI0022B8E603|nr:hypothetical protein [Paenibacillus caseinilyticus]MCZ8520121.1 hypothetical protein [Paenibacillus caseinilyticus]